jgi:hypothetical protein
MALSIALVIPLELKSYNAYIASILALLVKTGYAPSCITYWSGLVYLTTHR